MVASWLADLAKALFLLYGNLRMFKPTKNRFFALCGSVCKTVQGANIICKIHNNVEDFMKLH